jgi:hypothetical protein
MSKRNKSTNLVQDLAPEADGTEVVQGTELVQDAPEEGTEESQDEVPAKPARARSIDEARLWNFGKVVNPEAPEAAGVVRTAKGVNAVKARVYGYDTTDGGVPKAGTIVLVPGTVGTPKGVTPGQWELLQGFAGQTVQACYDAKTVTSRTVRRSYRAGFIRFAA